MCLADIESLYCVVAAVVEDVIEHLREDTRVHEMSGDLDRLAHLHGDRLVAAPPGIGRGRREHLGGARGYGAWWVSWATRPGERRTARAGPVRRRPRRPSRSRSAGRCARATPTTPEPQRSR